MPLTVYGARWCPDTRFAEKALAERGLPYSFISVEGLDKPSVDKLIAANNGEDWAVPTFFDGEKYFACPTMDGETFEKVMAFYGQ